MTDRNSWSADSQRRSLLQKIQSAGSAFRDIDDGSPFTLLQSALTKSIPPNRLPAIEPPTYGFGSVEAFFEFGSPILGPIDRWILPILASSLTDFYWRETWGARPLAATAHDAFEALGSLPVKIPQEEIQDRLGSLVQLVRAASDDPPLVLELRSDSEDLVLSIFGLVCAEIEIVEGDSDET